MPIMLDDTILAIFMPPDPAVIAPNARRDVGKPGRFVAAWRIEPGERFAGQFAMVPMEDAFHFSWCPEEDLTRI